MRPASSRQPSRKFFVTGSFFVSGLLSLVLLTSSAFAQTTSATGGSTPSGLTRGNPAGGYPLSGFESVNLFNGNLNASLPLLQVGGRGSAQTALTLGLNSKGWRVEREFDQYWQGNTPEPNWWAGLNPGYGPGVLQGRYGALQTRSCRSNVPPYDYYSVNKYTFTTLTFIRPDGTEYELRDQQTSGQPLTSTACNTNLGPARGTIFTSQDGAGITFISDTTIYDMIEMGDGIMMGPSGYLLFRDGTRYRIDSGKVSWIRDPNGNKISFAYDTYSRATTVTDSLNRQINIEYDVNEVAPYSLCDRITFRGTGGQPRIIRISKTSLGNALRTGYSLQSPHDLFPGLDGSYTSYNPTVAWKLWLPNSNGSGQHYQFYQFFYNSYGELARVELPTGGAIEYDMVPGPGIISSAFGSEIYRRVAERRVYTDGTTLENRTTYSAVASASSDAWPWTTTVTVDQLSSSATLLARSKHYFNGSAPAALNQTAGDRRYIYPAWDEGQEYQTEAFAADGTTVLRRVNNTSAQRTAVSWWSSWATQQGLNSAREPACDPRLTQVVSTLVDSNQVSQETFNYDQFNNQTDAYEYDFGVSSAGALVRRSHTDYLITNPVNGVDYTTTSIYLRGLPTQTSVYDAGGVERARTTFEYDNYLTDSNHALLTSRPGISGFDAAFNTSYTTRGNATATTGYLITNGAVPDCATSPSQCVTGYEQYDVAGNAVKMIDPRGYATTLEYDDRFGVPDGDAQANSWYQELGSQTTYAFATKAINAMGQITYSQHDYYTGLPVDGEDPNGVVASGYYNDLLDRPTQVIRASNQSSSLKSQTSFAYDDAARTITTTGDRDAFNDNLLKASILYDGLGRTIESRQYENSSQYIAVQQVPFAVLQDPDSGAWVTAGQSSNPFRPYLNEQPVWTTTFADSLGRASKVRTPDNAIARTSYSGNTVTVTDQAGKSRQTVSDGLGRLTQVYEDPSGLNYLTNYAYDVLGNLLTVSQGSQTRTFAYDSLKRLTSATNPESGTTCYGTVVAGQCQANGYDANGNLIYKTDARNITTTFAYDALNRPVSKTYSNDPLSTPPVYFYYDSQTLPSGAPSGFDRGYATGALVAVTYGGSSASAGTYLGYDALGRAVRRYQQTDSVNYLTEATYYANNSLHTETYPSVPGYSDRRTVSYTNDGAGRTASLSSNATSYAAGASVTSIGYASHNALTTETYGSGLVHAISYNTRFQTSEIRLGTSSNPTSILDLAYNYGTTNNNGNILSIDYSLGVGGHLQLLDNQSFSYDTLNRLSTATETSGGGTSWSQTNGYDRYGNRWIDYGGGNQNLTFSASTNRITNGGFSYDSSGNLLNDGVHAYTYDAENKIRTVDSVTTNTFDGEGRRVKKLVGENIRFIYGIGGQLIAEFNSSAGNLMKEYIYGGGTMVTIAPNGKGSLGVQYATSDHLGTPRVITNSSGTLVSRHDYKPFGEEIFAGTGGRTTAMGFSVSDGLRKKFTGYERDNETGLDFAQARYYSNTQAGRSIDGQRQQRRSAKLESLRLRRQQSADRNRPHRNGSEGHWYGAPQRRRAC